MTLQARFMQKSAIAILTMFTISLGRATGQEAGNSSESIDRHAQLSDRTIALAVENELLSSEAVDSHRIDVDSKHGIVTLSGKVDNLLAKRHASEVAQHVKDVTAVVNRIVVVPGDRKDDKIAEDVMQAWASDDVTERFELQVDVEHRVATVSGTVESHAERKLAEKIAAGVRGVTEIENKIEVEDKDSRTDEEIQEEVQSLMESAAELGDADIEVDVENGMVVLNGQVGSAFAKSVAEAKAWVAGVAAVDDRGLKVDSDVYDGTLRRKRLENVTDEKIVETINLALQQDPRVLSYLDEVEVESEGGSVLLTGAVGRLRAKRAAEQVARSVVGVWRVENHLKVRWPEKDPPAQEIIDNVQAALERDPYVSRHAIRVHCRNGHVSLYGLVDTEFEKEAANWIAGTQRGVVHVNNYVAVAKEWEPKNDAEIKADIEEKLKLTFFDKSNNIDVTVEDGVAVLRGEVDTWRAWQAAMEKAIEAGARRPHNLLKVRYHPRHGGSRIYLPR